MAETGGPLVRKTPFGQGEMSMNERELSVYNGAALAFVGDAVFELIVREYIFRRHNVGNDRLHHMSSKFVSAVGQSRLADEICPLLCEEELAIYKRGRNAKMSEHKRASPSVHSRATGLESLIGYLYLSGRQERIDEILGGVFKKFAGEEDV